MARKVFINQNTGGDEDEQSSGGVLDFGMNAVYPLNQNYGPVKFFVFGGPRYSHYDVRWDYVGGDEDFDIVANSWGLGGGLRGIMPLNKNFSAVMQLGVDYYFPTSIYGHDATYYPNDSNINARNNGAGYTYTYADAVNSTTRPASASACHGRHQVLEAFADKMRRSVWFDLPVSNLADAMSFYEGLLGWTYRQMDNSAVADYVMIETDGMLIGGLRRTATRVPTTVGPEGPILYFTVEKLAEKVARAKELGAAIVGQIVDLGKESGRYQWIRDREGHLIGLWSQQ